MVTVKLLALGVHIVNGESCIPSTNSNMASARKKQDEKHLKILRELVSSPQNRQCFDCHQRGPTYVNMTIGSFVCTSCSGLLRGLTPPHRVKSISMATFNPEEIEVISSRGNEYCRRIWLGLYDQGRVTDTRDEQGIKDFMIAKYEKKRYYLDPSMVTMNGNNSQSLGSTTSNVASSNSAMPAVRPISSLVGSVTLPVLSSFSHPPTSNQNAFTPDGASSGFLVDFHSMSAHSGSTSNKVDPFGPAAPSSSTTTNSSNFADFDNNPIFDSPNETDFFGTIPLSSFGAVSRGQASTADKLTSDLFSYSAKFNPNHRGMPPNNPLPSSQSFPGVSRKSSSSSGLFQPPPSEDRYAALKDLDCLMKSQQSEVVPPPSSNAQADWNQTSMSSWAAFGSSPQTGNFLGSAFPVDTNSSPMPSNPFTGSANPWNVSDSTVANPFLSGQVQPDGPMQFPWGVSNTNGASLNGFHGFHPATPSVPSSQSLTFPTKIWNSEPAGNPFTVGSSSVGNHSHNPFL